VRKISEGRFEITMDGTEREIVLPFGLKTEIYKTITKQHLKFLAAKSEIGISDETNKLVNSLSSEVRKAEDANADNLAELKTQLREAQERSYQEFLAARPAIFENSTLSSIDLTEFTVLTILSMLLSERDDLGKVTSAVTTEQLQWDPKYVEAEPELLELLQGVLEHVMLSAKKLMGIGSIVTGLTAQTVPQ
jgi:hypothetical protein